MEEMKTVSTYREFKSSLDRELSEAAAGFVRIGYLLKVARDTNVLYESGYKSVTEFAQAEYGLTKDIVSRYIAINDRYSEGGYSERLQEQYEGYGVAKLAEMLTLPDSVIGELDSKLTRAEIQEVKKELREEEKISDIEVMLEEKDATMEQMDLLGKMLYQYFYDNRKDFGGILKVFETEDLSEQIDLVLDVMAPSGVAAKMARIPGLGKLMLSIRGKDSDVDLLNTRTNEKEVYTWEKVVITAQKVFQEGRLMNPADAWSLIYKEEYGQEVQEEEKPEEKPVEQKPVAERNVVSEETSVTEETEPVAAVSREEKKTGSPASEPAHEEKPEVAPVQQVVEDPEEEIQEEYQSDQTDKITGVKEGFLRQNIEEVWDRLQRQMAEEQWKGAMLTASNLAADLQKLIDLMEVEEDE